MTFCYFSCLGWYCFRPMSMAALSLSALTDLTLYNQGEQIMPNISGPTLDFQTFLRPCQLAKAVHLERNSLHCTSARLPRRLYHAVVCTVPRHCHSSVSEQYRLSDGQLFLAIDQANHITFPQMCGKEVQIVYGLFLVNCYLMNVCTQTSFPASQLAMSEVEELKKKNLLELA